MVSATGRILSGTSGVARRLSGVIGRVFSKPTVSEAEQEQLALRAEAGGIGTRLLLTYLQGLSVLSVMRARGTALFQAVISTAEVVATSPLSWAPVSCTVHPSFHTRFWGTLLIPLLVVAACVVIFVVAVCVQWCGGRHPLQGEPGRPGRGVCQYARESLVGLARALVAELGVVFGKRMYASLLVVVLFLTYMPIIGASVKALECHERPIGGVLYLKADLGVECFAGEHLVTVAGAVAGGLCLVGLGLPLMLFVTLRRSTVPQSLLFLAQGYDDARSLRWWEGVVLLRKTALVLVASLMDDAITQSAMVILILVGSLGLQLSLLPFKEARFNRLETASLAVVFTTATLSLMYLQATGGDLEVGERGQALSPAMDVAVTAVLVGINLAMFAVLAHAAVRPRIPDSVVEGWTRQIRRWLCLDRCQALCACRRKKAGSIRGDESLSKPSFVPATLESTPNPLMSRTRAPGEKGSALPPLSREGP